MPIRLPRVSLKTVSVACKLDADLHADLEAYAAAYQAEHGDTMPIPTLIVTILWDYLQHDPDFMRQRRQAAAAPRARPTPASTVPRPPGQDRHNGPMSQPTPHAQGEGDAP